MKKYIFIAILSLLIVPLVGRAQNVVTLRGGAEISVNSITLTVSGTHVMDSITVNANSFDVVLSKGSTLLVESTARATLTASPAGFVVEEVCNDTLSSITLSKSTSGTETVTITPSSAICSTGGGGGIAGGAGGGIPTPVAVIIPGSGPLVAAVPTEPISLEAQIRQQIEDALKQAEALQAEINALSQLPPGAAPVAVAVSPIFTKSLVRGVSGPDVKRLQQLLNSLPDTRVAETGVGSLGNETNFFGLLTDAAVKKFQAKYSVVSSGSPSTTGFGRVGPKTRAKLAEVFAEAVAAPPPSSAPEPILSPEAQIQQQINEALKQVEALQAEIEAQIAPPAPAPEPVLSPEAQIQQQINEALKQVEALQAEIEAQY